MSTYKPDPHNSVLTLKVRRNKAPAKPGIAKALAYRHGIFDPKSDMEAMIEAFGLDAVIRLAHAIDDMRRAQSPRAFVQTPLISR